MATHGHRGKMILELAAPTTPQRKFYRIGDQEVNGAEYDLMAWLLAKGGPGTYKVAC